MQAIILSIGDELVLGQTVDTNSAWLSAQLAAIGCAVGAHVTVPDDQRQIERAILRASGECDVLIVSGGIGPTEDDLTRQALAAVMGAELELDASWLAELERFFALRSRPMPPSNRIQAMIPRGARALHNTAGTAAGIDAELTPKPGVRERPCRVFVVPGVPREMKVMFGRDILPHLQSASGGAAILSLTLHTFGLGESTVAEMLGELMQRGRNPSVGTTVSGGVVSLRLNARFESRERAAQELAAVESACRRALGDLIYGADGQSLQEVVAQLLHNDPAARKGSPAVSTAESCTGGLIAKMLTDVSGSSGYFRQGVVTYQNEAKTSLLGVAPDLIGRHGAVSEPVARAMAVGSQKGAGTAYALATTGIAGPGGGTPEKPVGTTWIALAHPDGVEARKFVFPGERDFIRDRAAKMALSLLRYRLLGKSAPF